MNRRFRPERSDVDAATNADVATRIAASQCLRRHPDNAVPTDAPTTTAASPTDTTHRWARQVMAPSTFIWTRASQS